MDAVIGHAENNSFVTISDSARQSGLYILGKPRVGKSWLIVNLILQDIQNGHGIFFIDPHGSTIDDLLMRIQPFNQFDRAILFDPEDENFTFGINPLYCRDVDHIADRNNSFTRTKCLFDKLWKDTFEQKPWLQLVLQNTIYAFIENQAYRIADFSMFFSDPAFRNFIVGNMKYNEQVKKYWLKDFAARSKHDQDEEMRAARTRVEIMLAHPFVIDILSHDTLDFEEMIDSKQVILFKLSAFLSYETKKIIGTIVVNELLHAVLRRKTKEQFCIFVDEFQTFASYEDFATLITDAPKFQIATTLAHHERFGQLLEEPKILGATAAIGNKILFQITSRDANELAPEFVDKPPTETRREEEVAITSSPVWYLLRGHKNPEICDFVDKHIRPLKDRLEDITGETEADRIIRQDLMDEANLYRIEERIEAIHTMTGDFYKRRAALAQAAGLAAIAKGRTENMIALQREAQDIRLNLRELNELLTAVMKGKAGHRTEIRKDFLITRAERMSSLTQDELEILIFVITVGYGNPSVPRQVSYRIAELFDILREERREVEQGIIDACLKERNEYIQEDVKHVRKLIQFWDIQLQDPWHHKEKDADLIESRRQEVEEGKKSIGQAHIHYKILYEEKWKEKLKTALLPACVLTDYDILIFKTLVMTNKWPAIRVLQEFVEFCNLFELPGNQIMTKTGQFVTKQVNTRTEADMKGEIVRKLTELSKYTAYASIFHGIHKWKGQIKTVKLEEPRYSERQKSVVREWSAWNGFMYCKLRILISRETKKRQESWRGDTDEPLTGEPLATHAEGEQAKARSVGVAGAGIGMPPGQFSEGD